MALPRWCSDMTSASAAISNNSFSSIPNPLTAVTAGLPLVSVPVLSNITASILAKFSITSPPLIKIPLRAAFPIPATIETGAEITSAPGHAITRKVSAR